MTPLAIVTVVLALLYIVGRGGFAIAPSATAEFYRRELYSSPSRMRAFGVALAVFVGVPLIVAVGQTPTAPQDVLAFLQVMGWLAVFAGGLVVAVPEPLGQYASKRFVTMPDKALRWLGVANIAFGLFIGWIAIVVL